MIAGILSLTPSGLYCEAGDFFIDPSVPVKRAIITHAHADHAVSGSQECLCSTVSDPLVRIRVGGQAVVQSQPYAETLNINGVAVTLFPAGHIPGSSQVLLESKGKRILVTGDFKRHADPLAEDYQPVKADDLIMETTFALPIFKWKPVDILSDQLLAWVRTNMQQGYSSIIFAYALGKAQQIIHYLKTLDEPILAHGAIKRFESAFNKLGFDLPALLHGNEETAREYRGSAIVVAPPSAHNSKWLKKFGRQRTAFASGWMAVRGNRRRRNVDLGLVMSDHADWDGLVQTVSDTSPERVWTTHGYADTFARYLVGQGIDAQSLDSLSEAKEQEDWE